MTSTSVSLRPLGFNTRRPTRREQPTVPECDATFNQVGMARCAVRAAKAAQRTPGNRLP